MFDTMLNVMSVTTDSPTEEELAAGANPEMIVTLVPGIMLPLADPSNPGQPIVVPGGQIRFRLDGDAAQQIGAKMVEDGQRLPRRTRVEIASSLAGAEQAARQLDGLRG